MRCKVIYLCECCGKTSVKYHEVNDGGQAMRKLHNTVRSPSTTGEESGFPMYIIHHCNTYQSGIAKIIGIDLNQNE